MVLLNDNILVVDGDVLVFIFEVDDVFYYGVWWNNFNIIGY